MVETHVAHDDTLAGQIARRIFQVVGGQRTDLAHIYSITKSVRSGSSNERVRRASIRATLQSACGNALQSHNLRQYFRNPARGVWQLTPSATQKLRRVYG